MKLFIILQFIHYGYCFYTKDIVVELKSDAEDFALLFGEKHGLKFVKRVFPNHFHYEHPKIRRRSTTPRNFDHFENDPDVIWFEQQRVKNRTKRDFVMSDPLYKVNSIII
jgi:hypothetical protein